MSVVLVSIHSRVGSELFPFTPQLLSEGSLNVLMITGVDWFMSDSQLVTLRDLLEAHIANRLAEKIIDSGDLDEDPAKEAARAEITHDGDDYPF